MSLCPIFFAEGPVNPATISVDRVFTAKTQKNLQKRCNFGVMILNRTFRSPLVLNSAWIPAKLFDIEVAISYYAAQRLFGGSVLQLVQDLDSLHPKHRQAAILKFRTI